MGGRVLNTVPDVQALLAVLRRHGRSARDLVAKGIKARGEIRDQYHHSVDIVPTILEVVGLEMPKIYRGVEQFRCRAFR